MGASRAHPFDEMHISKHAGIRQVPTGPRLKSVLKSATSVRASSFKSALSFFSHWDPATVLSLRISRKHTGVIEEPGRAGWTGPEGPWGPVAGASRGRGQGKAGKGFSSG